MTVADEDTNSILTDNANRAFRGNVAMQVAQPLLQQRKDVWNIRKRKKEVPLLKRLQKNLIIKKKRAGQ